MKILSWNKTGCNIQERMIQIKDLINKEKPHVLFINELNFNPDQNKGITFIKNYTFETDNFPMVNKTARTGVWIKQNLNYSREKKIELNNSSIIAINIGFHKKNKILLIRYYRQHNLLKQTKSSNSQKNKAFQGQVDKIKEIIKNNKEVILIGDINIDMLALNKAENLKTNTQKSQNPLINIIKNDLINNGLKLLNNKPTFYRDNNQYSSQLDVVMANKINKINKIIQIKGTDYADNADHDIIGCIRTMNVSITEEKYFYSRDLNNLNFEEINMKVINHELYNEALTGINSDNIAIKITKIINDVFKDAPYKKTKNETKKVKPNKIIINATNLRNKAYKIMKENNSIENIRNFKNTKIETSKIIREQYVKDETNKFKDKIDNSKKLWGMTKNKIYGENNTNIERIFYNDTFNNGSKMAAEAVNNFLKIKGKNYQQKS